MTFETQRYALISVRDQLQAQATRLKNLSVRNGNKQQKKVLLSWARQLEEVLTVMNELDELK
jgi:hypothetical protein